MKKILLAIMMIFSLLGCSEKKEIEKATFEIEHPEQKYILTDEEVNRVIDFLDEFDPSNYDSIPNDLVGCVSNVVIYYRNGEEDVITYYGGNKILINGILYQIEDFPLVDIWEKYH